MPSSIPPAALKCNICPKRPNFSDTSHLLTHVSSKGHLSCYFKLQVRSNQEPEAGRLLAEYDAWYQEQNLATLLADRMQAKINRRERTGGKRQSAASAASNNHSTNDCKIDTAVKADPVVHPISALPPYLDPRLSYIYNGTTINVPHGLTGCAPAPAPAPPAPAPAEQTEAWQEQKHQSAYPEEICPARNVSQAVDSEGSGASSPLDSKRQANENKEIRRSQRARKSTVAKDYSDSCPNTDDPFVDTSSIGDSFLEEEFKQVKLKGILWPGMDIFDSATEQMRKRRNQKKDDSVLKKMEVTSREIEPTEQVFSPSGTLQVERVITGNPEDYSPIRGETPVPPPSKKRPVRTRRALSKSDGNLYNLRNRVRKGTKAGRKARASLEEISRQALPLLDAAHSPLSLGAYFGPFDDDFNMTYMGMDKRPQRHSFNIFQERDGEHACREDGLLQRPSLGPFQATRPQNRFCNTNPLSACTYNFVKPYALHRSSTMPDYSAGKENVDPYSHTTDYPYFYPQAQQLNFGFAQENSNPFGRGRNPLSCALSSTLQNEAIPKLGGSTSRQEDKDQCEVKREVSPTGAVLPELDREDFANVLHGF